MKIQYKKMYSWPLKNIGLNCADSLIQTFFFFFLQWASLIAQTVKNPPAMQETLVWSLGWEDPLEKSMATHSSNLSWRISWTVLVCSVAELCLTLRDPTDCSPQSSSVHRLFPARILEWVAISSSRGSSPPRDWTYITSVSCIGRWIFYHWNTKLLLSNLQLV